MSFIIVLIRDASQPDRSIFEIEHIQTGDSKRAASFAELHALMLAALSPEGEPARVRIIAKDKARENESRENKSSD